MFLFFLSDTIPGYVNFGQISANPRSLKNNQIETQFILSGMASVNAMLRITLLF